MQMHTKARWCCIVLGAVFLVGCGGGGGGGDTPPVSQGRSGGSDVISDPVSAPLPPTIPTPVPQPDIPDNSPKPGPTVPAVRDLIISEYSYEHEGFGGNISWIEVYNPNTSPILLSDYTLKSSWRSSDSSDPVYAADRLIPTEFSLPAVSVPAEGYLVLAARIDGPLMVNTDQVVYVSAGQRYPHWHNTAGSIELLKQGQTVDFVKHGESRAMPATPEAWTGANISYPRGRHFDMGNAIIRLSVEAQRDTNTAADWARVSFATPGGRNDVSPNAVDLDNDGIPDSAEVPGGTYAGLDLYAWGARVNRKDIFVEMDYMVYSTGQGNHSLQPQEEALRMVSNAFAKKNAAIHFDVGPAYSTTFSPEKFNLGGGNALPRADCIYLGNWRATPENCTPFLEYKQKYIDVRRSYLFHYAVFALNANDALGVAEYFGNDIAIATAPWTNGMGMAESEFNTHVNFQASTIMHELGHNFGLHHGGLDEINFKPNHYSIMNYLYAHNGLNSRPDGMDAASRFLMIRNGGHPCSLNESICSKAFVIDYSDGIGVDLDENNVLESLNIGRGSTGGAYADWNGDGRLTENSYVFRFDLYLSEVNRPLRILKDYDEWGNLELPYSDAGRAAGRLNVGLHS